MSNTAMFVKIKDEERPDQPDCYRENTTIVLNFISRAFL